MDESAPLCQSYEQYEQCNASLELTGVQTREFNITTDPNSTRNPYGDFRYKEPYFWELYALSFLIFFCTVSLVVNLVILSSIYFMRTKYKATLYLIRSLAGADAVSLFLLGLGLFLFSFLPRAGILIDAPCTLLVIETMRMAAVFTTLFHLAALGYNHYLGIRQPLRYPMYMTRRNVKAGIVLLWVMPSLILFLYIFYIQGDDFNGCSHVFILKSKFRVGLAAHFFITLGIMIFFYVHIYVLVSKNQNKPIVRRAIQNSTGNQASQVTKKVIVTTLMILGSTVVGWAPAFGYFGLVCEDCLLRNYWKLKTPLETVFLYLINFLLICKTATNCYIYAFRVKEIKKALRSMRAVCCSYVMTRDSSSSDGGYRRTFSRQATESERIGSSRSSQQYSIRKAPRKSNDFIQPGQKFNHNANTSV